MAYTDQQSLTGQFVTTTNVWELGVLQEVKVDSPEFKELLVRLYQNVNNIALSLNQKESGLYLQEEFVNSNVYFNPTSSNQLDLRPVFRKVINFGALGAGANTVAHGLTIATTWSFTQIYATASDTANNRYYPIPWASSGGAANIEIKLDATNIVITNSSGVTFPVCMVVLEYLKQ